jgi:hypothetical protein
VAHAGHRGSARHGHYSAGPELMVRLVPPVGHLAGSLRVARVLDVAERPRVRRELVWGGQALDSLRSGTCLRYRHHAARVICGGPTCPERATAGGPPLRPWRSLVWRRIDDARSGRRRPIISLDVGGRPARSRRRTVICRDQFEDDLWGAFEVVTAEHAVEKVGELRASI